VDLGGVDGLIHVSELSWKHVEHPSEVVQVGQEVTVEVLDVDLERERISLSLKKTQEDPWHQFAREHTPNEILDGEVTKLVPFGAFVRVGDGVEGLVHISELSDKHVETAEQVVTVGQKVPVKIIEIDGDRRRISLSIRQAMPGGGAEPLPDDEITPAKEPLAEEPVEAVATDNGAVASKDVLEAAMAPEVEPRPTPAAPEADEASEPGAEGEAKPLGEETIESIIADLKRRTEQKE
jgi:small subunit ribosomal protein S1